MIVTRVSILSVKDGTLLLLKIRYESEFPNMSCFSHDRSIEKLEHLRHIVEESTLAMICGSDHNHLLIFRFESFDRFESCGHLCYAVLRPNHPLGLLLSLGPSHSILGVLSSSRKRFGAVSHADLLAEPLHVGPPHVINILISLFETIGTPIKHGALLQFLYHKDMLNKYYN